MATAAPRTEPLKPADLKIGDRLRITQRVRVGLRVWHATLEGRLVEFSRRRHGLHVNRAADDKVFSDVLVLRRSDSGELTTAAIDEYTWIERIESGDGQGDAV